MRYITLVAVVVLASGCSRGKPGQASPSPVKSASQQQNATADKVTPEVWKHRAVVAINDYLSKPDRKKLAAALEEPLASPEHFRCDDSGESVVVTVFGLKGGGTGIKVAFDRITGRQLSVTTISGK